MSRSLFGPPSSVLAVLRPGVESQYDKALGRVMMAVLKDDTRLFKQFSDNESFRRWLTDTIFSITYDTPPPGAAGKAAAPPNL
jgi:hypothetical protein